MIDLLIAGFIGFIIGIVFGIVLIALMAFSDSPESEDKKGEK